MVQRQSVQNYCFKKAVTGQETKTKMEYVLWKINLPSFRAGVALRFFGAHLQDHFVPHHRNNYHPHLLSHTSLVLFSGLLVAVKIFTLSLVALGPAIPAVSSAITEENIISLTNQARSEYQLGTLSHSSILDKAAQAKAEDMLARGYFAHTSPEGATPWEFIEGAGYNYIAAGENLAVNFTQAEGVSEAWLNSPSHKANILNKNYEEIGIGIAQGEYKGKQSVFVVQMFGSPVEQTLASKNEPTPVQNSVVPVPPVAADGRLSITNATAMAEGSSLNITAEIPRGAVKAMVVFGEKAVMLNPKAQDVWEGEIPISSLQNEQIKLLAFDISGSTVESKLGYFTNSTAANFNVLGTSIINKVKWFGQTFDPKALEQKFLLLFISGLLASLILAIAIKRHVQHPNMIANSSLLVIFASLLYMSGL